MFSIDIIDIDKIMDAIPDKNDLMIVLDGIKKDEDKWRNLFGKCLLRGQLEVNHNFTDLVFLVDEITRENADDYIYSWGSVINALDKPTIIKIGNRKAGFKSVSDVVRGHLNKRDIYDKYMDQLSKK